MNLDEKRMQLESLGVHDLRNVGRMWGVPSPTLMKKEKLIESILQVMSGEKTFKIKNRAGRPAKNILTNKFKEELLPRELIDFAEQRNKESILIDRYLPFASDEKVEFSDTLEKMSGYLVKHKQFYYFCTQENNLVHVPEVFIVQFGLIAGDYINVIASTAKEKKYYIVRDIEKVNNEKPLINMRKLCLFKDVILSSYEICNSIKEGSKTHVFYNGDIDFIEKNSTFLNEIINYGFKLMIIAVGLPADGLLRIKKHISNCIDFVSFFENEPLYSFETINNAINHATILARSGEKIFILILNIENIFTELDLYFMAKGEHRDIHAYSTIKLLRKLMGLNRVLSNNGSITIYSTTSDKEFEYKI